MLSEDRAELSKLYSSGLYTLALAEDGPRWAAIRDRAKELSARIQYAHRYAAIDFDTEAAQQFVEKELAQTTFIGDAAGAELRALVYG